MPQTNPLDLMLAFVDARARGDVDAALACYEKGATLVVEPGKTTTDIASIREFIVFGVNLKPKFTDRSVVESGSLAIHYSRWSATFTAPDGQSQTIGGMTTDVLRKQADGSWLLAIDNPWGTDVLGSS